MPRATKRLEQKGWEWILIRQEKNSISVTGLTDHHHQLLYTTLISSFWQEFTPSSSFTLAQKLSQTTTAKRQTSSEETTEMSSTITIGQRRSHIMPNIVSLTMKRKVVNHGSLTASSYAYLIYSSLDGTKDTSLTPTLSESNILSKSISLNELIQWFYFKKQL